MNRDILELIIALAGLLTTVILFHQIPRLSQSRETRKIFPTLSIIIPARNEEKNLPLLLEDLSNQTISPLEIICIDDGSTDKTEEIAGSFGVKIIKVENKPGGWIGKSWACQVGADAAKGELLLFIDADVRLGPYGLKRLLTGYLESESTVSVQPYHKTEEIYEQFSLFFNLLQFAANGSALKKPYNTGLNGPLILMPRRDYEKVGGHKIIRSSVIDDVSLGLEMRKRNLPYRIYVGDEDISYRMYGDGMISLLEGWTKNFASGASKTPLYLLFLVFMWVTSLTSVPLHLISYAATGERVWIWIYAFLYALWVIILKMISKKIGKYHFWTTLIFPLALLVFLSVFAVSLFRKIFGLKVTWKGRKIDMGKSS